MPNNPVIHDVNVDGKVIQEIIRTRLLPSLEGLPVAYAVLGMLTFCVLIMKPDCSVEELKNAVDGASETLVLALSDVPEGGVN